MIPEKDLWPINDTWAYHDLCPGAQNYKSYIGYMERRYGPAADAADFCRKAQMVNYEVYRAIFEAWNRKMWKNGSGALLWMSHPCWPSMTWQLYSYDLEPTAALYGVKKACEPIHVQLNLDDGTVTAVNHTAEAIRGAKVTARLYNLDGALAATLPAELDLPADAATKCLTIKWPAGLSQPHFVKLALADAMSKPLAENFYWHAAKPEDLRKLESLPKATLTGTLERAPGISQMVVSVENPSSSVVLAVKLTLRRGKSRQRVLPAYVSDNYFSLLPGEHSFFRIDCDPADLQGEPPLVSLDGWNVTPMDLKLSGVGQYHEVWPR
jgi:hypothetical protein